MRTTGRAILAIVAGIVLWALIWNSSWMVGMQLLPDDLVEGQPITHSTALVVYLLLSVVASVAAGYVAAAIQGRDPMRVVWILAVIQFVIGVGVQVGAYWDMFPLWYHLPFLALVIPAHVFGGRLRATRRPVAPAPA